MIASELLKYVSKAAQVVNPSVLVPIAKNLLFDGSYIKATDLNTSIVVEFPDNLVDEPVAVDTQKLVAILKALKNEEISIVRYSFNEDYIFKRGVRDCFFRRERFPSY